MPSTDFGAAREQMTSMAHFAGTTHWVNTKLRWELSADPAEVAALANLATSRDC